MRKLCITGLTFRRPKLQRNTFYRTGPALEELLILNCHISPRDLEYIVGIPRSLKRFTLRGPVTLLNPHEEDDYEEFMDELGLIHLKSLEYLDLDIYGGPENGTPFEGLPSLKTLVTTPYSLIGTYGSPTMALPKGLKALTIRYEEGRPCQTLLDTLLYELKWSTLHPKLRTVVWQIPDNIRESPTTAEIRIEAEAFESRYAELGVKLSTELISYPSTMPEYDLCPCENLQYFHQFPFHPRPSSLSP